MMDVSVKEGSNFCSFAASTRQMQVWLTPAWEIKNEKQSATEPIRKKLYFPLNYK